MYSSVFLSAFLVASAAATGYGNGYSGSGGGGSSWGDWSSTSTNTASATVPAPALAATQAGEIVVQIVSVADNNGSLKYFPNSIQASPGTVVQFQFHPKNHTITESSFAAPCKPLAANLTSATRPGIKSGYVPVTGMESTTPVYNVLINDTKPIWIYCGQTNHCQKGMAMVINQNMSSTDKTIEAYIANAMMLPLANASAPSSTASSSASSASFSPVAASSSEVLPSPTSSASSSKTTSPTTFTGAASKQDILGVPAFAGLLFGGAMAIW